MTVLSMLTLQSQMILNREDGQDLIEYALLLGLISLAALAAINPISNSLVSIYQQIADQLAIA